MKLYFTILFITIAFNCFGQYLGGDSDGYATSLWQNTVSVYNGGSKSGYIFKNEINFESTFTGGLGSGYLTKKSNPLNGFFRGAAGSGYVRSQGLELTGYYSGGLNSGYNNSTMTNLLNVFKGATNDGYHSSDNIREIIWTGMIGNDWNVADNWNTLDVPRIRHHVLIPANVPNFPELSNGLFTIGQNKNEGIYFCKSLSVQANAEVTLMPNNYMENYGTLSIYGNLHVQSTINPSILNSNNGIIVIQDGGAITWE